jgi:hypothetical protein
VVSYQQFNYSRSPSSTHDMKLRMIGFTVWKPEPGDVLSTSEVVVFQLRRTPAETLLRTIGAMLVRSLRFHAAPPTSER